MGRYDVAESEDFPGLRTIMTSVFFSRLKTRSGV